jgi:hypothetical protein
MQRAYTHSNREIMEYNIVMYKYTNASGAWDRKFRPKECHLETCCLRCVALPIWTILGVWQARHTAKPGLVFSLYCRNFVCYLDFYPLITLYNACKGLRMHYSMKLDGLILAFEIRNPVVRILGGI